MIIVTLRITHLRLASSGCLILTEDLFVIPDGVVACVLYWCYLLQDKTNLFLYNIKFGYLHQSDLRVI